MQASKLNWGKNLETKVYNDVSVPTIEIIKLIGREMDRLLENPNQKLGISVPGTFPGSMHESKSRWNADRYTLAGVSDYADKFVEQVRSGISDIELSADAQDWDEAKVKKIRATIEKDVALHVKDFVGVLTKYERSFDGMRSYATLLGEVTMMCNELRLITAALGNHISLLRVLGETARD
ncbi:MAG: hypothetical protein KGH59_04260 [Candidatus Micrarchaeota archaeon]|nr:hypothetical protein [Candidatus Micrarchaeota archaeon]MDE1847177.1 hypothetical protein [Candidatus Micrarchaeota archaeon]